MQSGKTNALRTRIYVDGYNFYYGCLKKSAYKWLDLRMLIERILTNLPYEREGEPLAYQLVTPAVK
jgi:6-hydroxy-3-succinoylpyridine 3-monooxygenase